MKTDFSKIHPELRQAAKKFPKLTYSNKNLWFIHLALRLMPAPKAPEGISIENVFISSQNNKEKIRLRIYKPKIMNEPVPVLLWMHGGGYIMGTPEQDEARCIQYVRELNIVVVSVDYRCAPKHPFPAALDDCYSALQWIASQAQQLGIDNKRIAVGGASAGGGLAASLAQFAHDQNEIKPIFQLLIYPMLDDRAIDQHDMDDSNNITWNKKSNKYGWESYLGKKHERGEIPEYSVPARRNSLSGLPNAWVGVGTVDMFYHEDMAYALKLKEAGVQCEVYAVQGAFHGFDVFDDQIPVVQDFRNSQISALKKCFFGS